MIKALASPGVVLVAVLLELVAIWMLASGPAGAFEVAGVFALHLGAGGLCAVGLALRPGPDPGPDPERTASLAGVGGLIGLAFPGFGPLACLALSIVAPEGGRAEVPAESLELRRRRAAMGANERKRATQQLGAGIDALVDALKDRDAKVRVAAIDALKDAESPAAIKLLAQARTNTIFDVRIRAVERLGKISSAWSDRLADARAAWSANPTEPGPNRRLASLLVECGELGIESPEASRQFFVQAVQHAQAALDAGDDDREVLLALASALARTERWAAAEAVYRLLADRDDHDLPALLGLAEMQFLRQDLRALPLTCRWVFRQLGGKLEPEVADTLKLWSQVAGRNQ